MAGDMTEETVIRRVLPVGDSELQIEHLPLDRDVMLQTKATRYLHDWYLTQTSGGMGPISWSSFDLVDHAPIAENLFLVHTENPDAFQFALHGEKVKRLFKDSSWTREYVTADSDEAAKRTLHHCYRTIIENRCPYVGLISGRGGYIRSHQFESIDLPMTDESGRIVRILGVVDQIPDDKEVEI